MGLYKKGFWSCQSITVWCLVCCWLSVMSHILSGFQYICFVVFATFVLSTVWANFWIKHLLWLHLDLASFFTSSRVFLTFLICEVGDPNVCFTKEYKYKFSRRIHLTHKDAITPIESFKVTPTMSFSFTFSIQRTPFTWSCGQAWSVVCNLCYESIIWPGITIIDLFHSYGHLVIYSFLDILQMTWCVLSTSVTKEISIAQDVWTTFALLYHGDSQEQWSSAAIFIVFRIFQE